MTSGITSCAVPRTMRGRRALLHTVAIVAPLATLSVLAVELRHADLGSVLARLQPWQLAAAVGWFAVSLVAAAYNLSGFSAVRIRMRDGLLAQLAIGGLRVIAPSAVSTPLVATRFLTRSGLRVADATAAVGAAQTAQLLATVVVVAVLAGVSDVDAPQLPSPAALGIGAGVAAVLVLAGVLVARCSRRPARLLRAARAAVMEQARHARRHPGRVIGAVAASAVLTAAHMLAFAACVAAVGGSAWMITLAGVYLAAAGAGSLLPTPGGIGAVEAAMIGGLTAAGLSLPTATAATVLSRLVTLWLPALPGYWAIVRLRRAQLL